MGKFDKKSFKVSGGKNGVGTSIVNALSKKCEVQIKRDGKIHSISFSQGKVIKKLEVIGKCKKSETGTKVTFVPDPIIFKEFTQLKEEEILENLNLRSYINKEVILKYKNLKTNEEKVFHHPNGILDLLDTYVEKTMTDKLHAEFSDDDGNIYEIALCWNATTLGETFVSFVNGLPISRGTNETAVKLSALNAFNEAIKNTKLLKKKDNDIKGEDVREGLVCIMNIKHKKPEFGGGQTKDELANKEIKVPIQKAVTELILEYFQNQDNKSKVDFLFKRIIEFSKKRKEAFNMKQKIVNNALANGILSFSDKFEDCTSEDPNDETEVILVEGDSAAGSVKQSRIARLQAVYALKGKIKNTYNSGRNTILSNDELNELLLVLFGTNDISKIKEIGAVKLLRYTQIILACDSDNDGYHIVSLLLTFFHSHFPELIAAGKVYIAVSPLYRVLVKKDTYKYFLNDEQFNKFVTEQVKEKISITDGPTIMEILNCKDDFENDYNNIKKEYNLENEILDNMIYEFTDGEKSLDNVLEVLDEEFNLDIEETEEGTYSIEGFYEESYYNFVLRKEKIIQELSNIATYFDSYLISYKKGKEEFNDVTITEFLSVFNNFIIERNRLKGLGESDPEEIFETTFDPEKRTLIKVKLDENGKIDADNIQKVLFGNNTELRKSFIENNDI